MLQQRSARAPNANWSSPTLTYCHHHSITHSLSHRPPINCSWPTWPLANVHRCASVLGCGGVQGCDYAYGKPIVDQNIVLVATSSRFAMHTWTFRHSLTHTTTIFTCIASSLLHLLHSIRSRQEGMAGKFYVQIKTCKCTNGKCNTFYILNTHMHTYSQGVAAKGKEWRGRTTMKINIAITLDCKSNKFHSCHSKQIKQQHQQE